VELGVESDAITHGDHHIGFVEKSGKVRPLGLLHSSKKRHEDKGGRHEENGGAGCFADGTHRDSPE
ncbi:MAG: hypothetical protein WBE73_19020, partial [Candidatus Acidiferrum sp.]